jgi:hypothetical protein
MNLDSSTLPYFGSGRISRLGTSRRRGIFHLLIASVGIFSDTAKTILVFTYSTHSGSLRRFTAPRGKQHLFQSKDRLLT